MSAYVVSTDHIDLLVTALEGYGVSAYVADEAGEFGVRKVYDNRSSSSEDVGRELLRENVASVLHRYSNVDADEAAGYFADIEGYTYRPVPLRQLSADPAVAVLKAIDGYQYQACEHPAWGESAAKAITDALRSQAIDRLHGYEEAKTWEYTRA